MKRREFVALLCGACAWPLTTRAQQATKMPRIGMLIAGPSGLSPNPNPLLQELHDLGYTEGKNLALEFRYGEWKLDRLRDLAAELVALRVDLIVAASTPAARA